MKICTITCHDVYNYGASLQAFALMHYLEMLGHEVKIIDYKPDYLSKHYEFWEVSPNSHFYELANKSNFFKFFLCCYLAKRKYETYGRVPKFKWFKKHILKCTRRYNSYDDLQKEPPIADCYIAGSDQIWNTAVDNGKDPAFYCNFGKPETKRISYAASFAISEIQEELKPVVKQYLSAFDCLSVREKTGLKILESLGYDGVNVVDPVLLLTKDHWLSLLSGKRRPHKKPYIFVYDLSHIVPEIEEYATKWAKEQGWDIVSVNNGGHLKYADRNVMSAGPIDFINYIRHADMIISNSFHATAFSVIFNRPFACFYKSNNISRMSDFLNLIGLYSCLNPTIVKNDFNWNEVNTLLHSLIAKSQDFLISSLK